MPIDATINFFFSKYFKKFGNPVSDDVFAIDEVTMFEGENWTEKKYAVAGDILDGYLYDLFMNMLDERGVNKEFADKLSEYCSGI